MVKRIIILLFVFSSAYGQANRFAGFGSRNTCPVEAQKFIDSAGITNTAQKNAICVLVKDLQDSSLWTKLYTIYPFVGSSASAFKWNLKDPRNLDAAYRITWVGGVTFDSSFCYGNGTNGYGDTHFFGTYYGNTDSSSFGVQVIDNKDELGFPIGFRATSTSEGLAILPRYLNTLYSYLFSTYVSVSNTDSRGFYVATRTSSSMSKVFRNNSLFITNSNTVSANYTIPICILARYHSASVESPSTYKVGFVFIGNGLSDAQCSTLYTIFTKFKNATGK